MLQLKYTFPTVGRKKKKSLSDKNKHVFERHKKRKCLHCIMSEKKIIDRQFCFICNAYGRIIKDKPVNLSRSLLLFINFSS